MLISQCLFFVLQYRLSSNNYALFNTDPAVENIPGYSDLTRDEITYSSSKINKVKRELNKFSENNQLNFMRDFGHRVDDNVKLPRESSPFYKSY